MDHAHVYRYSNGRLRCDVCGRPIGPGRGGRAGRRRAAAGAAALAAALALAAWAALANWDGAGTAPDVVSEIAGAVESAARAPPVRLESGFDAAAVEALIHEHTNAERAGRGLPELARVLRIDSIARAHSEDMAARGYFGHDTPEGAGPSDRAAAAGYACRKDFGEYYTEGLAENIMLSATYSSYGAAGVPSSYAWLSGEGELARGVVDGWMGSPGHRENILSPDYDRIGIGVAITAGEDVYATQNFC